MSEWANIKKICDLFSVMSNQLCSEYEDIVESMVDFILDLDGINILTNSRSVSKVQINFISKYTDFELYWIRIQSTLALVSICYADYVGFFTKLRYIFEEVTQSVFFDQDENIKRKTSSMSVKPAKKIPKDIFKMLLDQSNSREILSGKSITTVDEAQHLEYYEKIEEFRMKKKISKF
jgi:hypothetical protein